VASWDAFVRWGDVKVSPRIRRIDLLLVALGIVCVGYYALTTGWQGAIVGGLLYILMVMMALWVF
jgi:glucose-6-phosphate-specific signal transduction histidine kinase